jgi:uncharacterized membrane protein
VNSVITEFRRPTQLTWRSIRGFKNSGTYRPTNTPEGTKVELTIGYNFQGGLLDGLMETLVIPLARTAAASILAKVKARLEHAHSIHSAKEHRHRKRRFLHAFTNKPHLRPRA